MRTAHGRVRRAISAVAMGRAVVVVDEVAAQGYLMYAADAATPALLAFTVRHTSGYVRVALPAGDCERLDLPPVCQQPTASAATAAHRVAVDAVDVGTGISATDRARTIATLADADATAADFRRPGHVVPVLAGLHGVLGARAGGQKRRSTWLPSPVGDPRVCCVSLSRNAIRPRWPIPTSCRHSPRRTGCRWCRSPRSPRTGAGWNRRSCVARRPRYRPLLVVSARSATGMSATTASTSRYWPGPPEPTRPCRCMCTLNASPVMCSGRRPAAAAGTSMPPWPG